METTDIYTKPSTPCFLTQILQDHVPSFETICHAIANAFLEIANFFRRLMCCGCEPLPLYTAKVIGSTPSSNAEEFRNGYLSEEEDNTLGASKSETELRLDLDSTVSIPDEPEVQNPNHVMSEEDKTLNENKSQEDCSLAILAGEQMIIEKKETSPKGDLPKNLLTNLFFIFKSVFCRNNPIFNLLSLTDLGQLCRVNKEINQTVNEFNGYLNKYRGPQINDLKELAKAITKELNLKNQTEEYFCQFNLNNINHLLEYLLSERRPVIKEDCTELQKNVLTFFFECGSKDQLSRFIQKECYLKKQYLNGSSGKYRLIYGEFNACFFNELTDERQKKLLLLLEVKNTTIVKDLIYSLVEICDIEVRHGYRKSNEHLNDLAEKLVCSFYEKRPDLEVWKEIEQEKDELWRFLRCDLIEKKISLLMDQLISSPDLETKGGSLKLACDIRSCFKTFPNDNNHITCKIVDRSFKNILLGILNRYDSVGEAITEKLFTAFVRAIALEPAYRRLFLETYNDHMSNSIFGELWRSKFEALSLKVLFQSLLNRELNYGENPWDQDDLHCIHTEGQINAFVDYCMELPEPLRTVQLCTLKSQDRFWRDQQKTSVKIFEERKIELPEDADKDWTDKQIYDNAFNMKRLFEKILELDSQEKVGEWTDYIDRLKTLLQVLAGGVVLLDGSTIKCPLDADNLKKAFQANKLDYGEFAKPIAVYDLLKTEHLRAYI